jgi:hypothetical protein
VISNAVKTKAARLYRPWELVFFALKILLDDSDL